MYINYELIAENIKRLRQEQNITQQHLADAVGITKSAISQIEKMKMLPTDETLAKISRAFNDPTAIYCYNPAVVEMFYPVIEKLEKSYQVLDRYKLIKNKNILLSSKNFFFKSSFITSVKDFFESLTHETSEKLFPSPIGITLYGIADFCKKLPDSILTNAFGKRHLEVDIEGSSPKTIAGLLAFRIDPPLSFEEIAPAISNYLRFELKRRDMTEDQFHTIIQILTERKDLAKILYPIVVRLYETSPTDNFHSAEDKSDN
jgi:transcriptional regulator with XRE-family HTH domain